jgi:hypothetical protein
MIDSRKRTTPTVVEASRNIQAGDIFLLEFVEILVDFFNPRGKGCIEGDVIAC